MTVCAAAATSAGEAAHAAPRASSGRAASGAEIVDHQGVPAVHQAARHRHAHVAEPDEADRLAHAAVLPPVCSSPRCCIGFVLIALAAASWGTTGATMTLLSREAARVAAARRLEPPRHRRARPRARRRRRRSLRRAPSPRGAPGRRSPICRSAPRSASPWPRTRSATSARSPSSAWPPAALLAICSAPLLIAVLAALFLGERLTPLVRLSLGMAVAGTALLVVGPRGFGEIAGRFGLGALLALGAGVSYAVYAVAAKGLLARVTPLRGGRDHLRAGRALPRARAARRDRARARARGGLAAAALPGGRPHRGGLRAVHRGAGPRARHRGRHRRRCSSRSPPPRSACSCSASAWAPSASRARRCSWPPSPS